MKWNTSKHRPLMVGLTVAALALNVPAVLAAEGDPAAGWHAQTIGQALVYMVFQATVRRVEPPDTSHPAPGDVWYGFIAQSGSATVLVRWNQESITYFHGKMFQPAEIKSAFRH